MAAAKPAIPEPMTIAFLFILQILFTQVKEQKITEKDI
jgi:hypothetical protein